MIKELGESLFGNVDHIDATIDCRIVSERMIVSRKDLLRVGWNHCMSVSAVHMRFIRLVNDMNLCFSGHMAE